MQTLYGQLPRAVCVGGVSCALRTDFRVALRILAAFEDESLTAFEQQGILLQLLYDTPPPDTAEAVRLGLLFLNCGTAPTPQDEAECANTGRLFSFAADAPLICAALQRSHGVDISAASLHWYRFVALFSDISEQTFFARVVALRRGLRLGTLTREERRAAAQLAHWVRLPGAPLTGEEREFFALLGEPQAGHGAEACTADEA